MFDIYKYDRRLLDDYMEICNDLETALQSFDTLHSAQTLETMEDVCSLMMLLL